MKKINYHQLSIMQLHSLLVNKEITSRQLFDLVFKRLEKFKYLNGVITLLKQEAYQEIEKLQDISTVKDNPLFSIPFGIKDNIATKNQKTTAGSNMLSNFVSYYDSTVNKLLKESNAISIAKTNLDELGMGGDGLYSNTSYVYNPWNIEHIIGGSSSGSAALVASGVVPFALGTDTGDSVRRPAAFSGIFGFKPTYGLISRNGVIPYAPSLDTVGILANHVADIANVLDVLVKEDVNDFSNLKSLEKDYYKNLNDSVSGLKIAILNYKEYEWSADVKNEFDKAIKYLVDGGAVVEYIDFSKELLVALLPVYMIISFIEATSCHAGLDGINFGLQKKGQNYSETMIKSRTAGFGPIVKRRYVIGAYVLDMQEEQMLLKAKKVRRLIVEELEKIFKKFDAFIVMPSVNGAPKIIDVLKKQQNMVEQEHKYMEDLLLLANFNGCPSITIPLTLSQGLPVGININSACFKDQVALNIASFLSKKINFKNKFLGDENE